jgi:IS1 family transposase
MDKISISNTDRYQMYVVFIWAQNSFKLTQGKFTRNITTYNLCNVYV